MLLAWDVGSDSSFIIFHGWAALKSPHHTKRLNNCNMIQQSRTRHWCQAYIAQPSRRRVRTYTQITVCAAHLALSTRVLGTLRFRSRAVRRRHDDLLFDVTSCEYNTPGTLHRITSTLQKVGSVFSDLQDAFGPFCKFVHLLPTS